MSFEKKVYKKKHLILEKLSSPFLAGILFILLAFIILIGTCIPQEPLVGKVALVEKFGNSYEFLKFWGILDVFHSWWYIALLFLLAINLTVVSFVKVFPRAKRAFSWPKFIENELSEKKSIKSISSNLWNKFQTILKRNGWKIKVNNSGNSLVAIKGAYHRLGASVTHVGILLTMSGALYSLLFGFNGVVQGVQGDRFILSDRENSKRSYILVETSKVFHSPLWFGKSPELEVEIVDSSKESYKDGRPKQWTTKLQFLNNKGNLLADKTVSVNNPIHFQGVDFYQADWKKIMKVIFNKKEFEIILNEIKGNQVAYVAPSPNLGLLFLITKEAPQKLNLISVRGEISADIFTGYKNLMESDKLKFLGSLQPGEDLELGPMNFKYKGSFAKTGVQYKSSPGDWIMIVGMCILISGVMMAFGAKRTIWANINLQTNQIDLIATSDRSKEMFGKEYNRLLDYLSES
ncbi:MAG: cytochrome c biogenesis protein ResB [Candidatus Caenarcaniphilales bacterium]|nr:cytochrome c biogenesis protein ResB [Candidatus Caenarcaniphilales bacterium]